MANFMGPMAPPQAAPSQPPQLDVRTNPGQRAQFKSFMQGMQVPPTTAPVAPMLPAPTPMDDIDIFAPAPMADGGVVGGLQNLGQMSGQMVEALNTVVYGGSQGGGFGGGMPSSGGIGGPMSSGGGFGGGQMPAPLPPITTLPPGATPPALLPPVPMPIGAVPNIDVGSSTSPQLPDRLSLNDMSLLGMPTPAYMPMDPDGDGIDNFGRPMESQLTDEQRAQAEQDQQERLKNLRSRFSEGGAFGSGSMGSPLSRLGVMGGLGSIFGYEDGGAVDPYAIEGKIGQSVGPRMVGGTTNVLEGSGGDSGVTEDSDTFVDRVAGPLMQKLQQGQDLYNVNASYNDPSRPLFGFSELFAPGAPFADTIAQPPTSAPSALQNAMNFAGDIMRGVQAPGPMGGAFNVRPVVQRSGLNDSLGIMANFSLPFEDGGPVGMFLGGDPRAYGDERGRQDTSETARERVGGTSNVFAGDSSSREERDETDRTVATLARVQAMEDKAQLLEDMAASTKPVNIFPGTSVRGNPVASMGITDTEERLASQENEDALNVGDAQRLAKEIMDMRAGDFDFGPVMGIDPVLPLDIVESLIGPQPRDVGPVDQTVIDFINRNPQPPADSGVRINPSTEDSGVGGPIGSDNVIFSGVEDTSVEGPLAEAGSSVDRLMVTPITNLRGGGQRTAGEDLTMRSESGIAKKLPQNVIENINKGRPAVIDARSGQIAGYVGEGLFGIGNAYTGRPGYDPFGPNATFDPARNAYIVQPNINTGDSDERVLPQASTILPPATDPADTTPPPLMISPPTTSLPPSVPDVLVPSTRTNVPITAPSLLPTQGVAPTFLPQSFLDLLANFNRPAPVAMQDGGAVLDKAADNFLEALKVA